MIENIREWFKRAVPEPQPVNQKAQLSFHMEEFAEMLDALVASGINANGEAFDPAEQDAAETYHAVKYLGEGIRYGKIIPSLDKMDRKEFLDSLCDQIVTAVGVAHMLNLDIVGALNEVNKSNWSKFDADGQPIFDETKKIIKGPNYFKPVLDPFI